MIGKIFSLATSRFRPFSWTQSMALTQKLMLYISETGKAAMRQTYVVRTLLPSHSNLHRSLYPRSYSLGLLMNWEWPASQTASSSTFPQLDLLIYWLASPGDLHVFLFLSGRRTYLSSWKEGPVLETGGAQMDLVLIEVWAHIFIRD